MDYQKEYNNLENVKDVLTKAFKRYADYGNPQSDLASGLADVIRTQAYLSLIIERKKNGTEVGPTIEP